MIKVKESLGLFFLFTLIAFALVISGCGGGSGGNANSQDEEIARQLYERSYFKIDEYDVSTKLPGYVDILFHVKDIDGEFVTSFMVDDFEVLEDGESISPTESKMKIVSNNEVPYKLKFVLMIDNSSSVETKLPAIINAAKALVSAAIDPAAVDPVTNDPNGNIYFKIYTFSEFYNDLMPDDGFSNDADIIKATIDSIEIGNATTDLYGSVIEGVSQWSDTFNNNVIEEGALVLLTDGSHTQGNSSLVYALAKRVNKRVFTIGIGDEVQPEVLEQLGNAGYYQINDSEDFAGELTSQFLSIHEEVDLFSKTFYWLSYLSPKRGGDSNRLTLKVKENTNVDIDKYSGELISAEIVSSFKSEDFFTPGEGIYINNVLPIKGDEYYVNIKSKEPTTVLISFDEYINKNLPENIPATPNFDINDDDCTGVVNMVPKDPDDPQPSVYLIKPVIGVEEGLCRVTITDDNNQYFETDVDGEYAAGDNLSRSFTISINKYGTPTKGLIAHYDFDKDNLKDSSKNGNDATSTDVYSGAFTGDRFGNVKGAIYIDTVATASRIRSVKIPDVADAPRFSSNKLSVSMWFVYEGLGTSDLNPLLSDGDQFQHLTVKKGPIGFYNDGFFPSDSHLIVGYGAWYHIVLVKDNYNSKLYINDKLVQDSNESFNNESNPLSIIGNTNAGGSIRGKIDDVRIYDRVLSEIEIESLFLENK